LELEGDVDIEWSIKCFWSGDRYIDLLTIRMIGLYIERMTGCYDRIAIAEADIFAIVVLGVLGEGERDAVVALPWGSVGTCLITTVLPLLGRVLRVWPLLSGTA
jgi:hypothetical protein